MKVSTNLYRQSAVWLCLLSFAFTGCERMQISDDLAGFDPNGELAQFAITLSGPGQAAGERILDIDQVELYTLAEAQQSTEKVDFVMLWGATSGMNFIAPLDINRLDSWAVGQGINESWLVKNGTMFMKLNASYADVYDAIKDVDDVKKAYEQTRTLVTELDDYSQVIHGPNMSIRGVQPGDIIFFKTSKDVFAVAKVLELTTGFSGRVKLVFKSDMRNKKQIDPIDESERIDLYQVSLTKPAFYDGKRFLDATTGVPYSNSSTYTPQEEHAFYHQEDMDFIFLNGSSSGANLIVPVDADYLSGWGSGDRINENWLVKNEGTFIKLDASAKADSIFLHTYTRTKLHEAYQDAQTSVLEQPEYDADKHGPGMHISGIKAGDVVFFQSASKNVLAMFQVTSYTAGSSGSLGLAAKVDNTEKINVPRSPSALQYGQITMGGWSANGAEGNTYHVDLATLTRHDPASADASQGSIDMLNLWSGSGFVNFMTPTSGSVTAWGSSSRIADWTTRNDGTFIRLSSPTEEEKAVFEGLVSRDALVQAYEHAAGGVASRAGYDEANDGPSIRIRHLTAGDIVYFKSNAPGRNLYAAIEVLSVTPGTSNGREVVVINVKSNLLNE